MITRRKLLLSLALPTLLYPAVSAAMAFGLTRTRRLKLHDTPGHVGLEYDEVTFPSADGRVELAGWLIPPCSSAGSDRPEGQRWAVLVHGYGAHRGDPQAGALGLARDLHREGFGVLTFDMRGCGTSAGRGSVGYYERYDVLGALDFLAGRGVDRANIGVIGFSLGGVVALTACAVDGVAGAVVADSAFSDLWAMVRANATGARRPLAPFHPGMDAFARWLYGIDLGQVSPASSVAASNVPVLIIHGEDDVMVPVSHARLISEAATSNGDASAARRPVEVWTVPGAGHVQSYHTQREEYVRRVSDFFARTLDRPVP